MYFTHEDEELSELPISSRFIVENEFSEKKLASSQDGEGTVEINPLYNSGFTNNVSDTVMSFATNDTDQDVVTSGCKPNNKVDGTISNNMEALNRVCQLQTEEINSMHQCLLQYKQQLALLKNKNEELAQLKSALSEQVDFLSLSNSELNERIFLLESNTTNKHIDSKKENSLSRSRRNEILIAAQDFAASLNSQICSEKSHTLSCFSTHVIDILVPASYTSSSREKTKRCTIQQKITIFELPYSHPAKTDAYYPHQPITSYHRQLCKSKIMEFTVNPVFLKVPGTYDKKPFFIGDHDEEKNNKITRSDQNLDFNESAQQKAYVKELEIRIEDLTSTVEQLHQEKQELITKLMVPNDGSPTDSSTAPAVSIDSTEKLSLVLLVELMQCFAQQSEAFSEVSSRDAISLHVSQIEFVLETVQERLPYNCYRDQTIQSSKTLLKNLLKLAEAKFSLHQLVLKLQSMDKASKASVDVPSKSRQTNKKSENQVKRAVTTKPFPDATQQPKAASENYLVGVNNTKNLDVIESQVANLKELLRSCALERDAKDSSIKNLELENDQLKAQLLLHTRPPTQEILNKLNLDSEIIMKVRDPYSKCVWCCLITAQKNSSEKSDTQISSDDPADEARPNNKVGISWWRENDLESHMLKIEKPLIVIQDDHNIQIEKYQRSCRTWESKYEKLQQQLESCKKDFQDYKKQVACILSMASAVPLNNNDSYSVDVPPNSTTFDKEVPAVLATQASACPECQVLKLQHEKDFEHLQEEYNKNASTLKKHYEYLLKLKDDAYSVFEQCALKEQERLASELEAVKDVANQYRLNVEAYRQRLQNHCAVSDHAFLSAKRKSQEIINKEDKQVSTDDLHMLKVDNEASSNVESTCYQFNTPYSVELPAPAEVETPVIMTSKPQLYLSQSMEMTANSGFYEAPSVSEFSRESKKQLRLLEKQLSEERSQQILLYDQMTCLKQELRKAEALLNVNISTRCSDKSPETRVPLEFIRNTLLKFLETDPFGIDEHESLVPVISQVFAFSTNDIEQVELKRNAYYGGRKAWNSGSFSFFSHK